MPINAVNITERGRNIAHKVDWGGSLVAEMPPVKPDKVTATGNLCSPMVEKQEIEPSEPLQLQTGCPGTHGGKETSSNKAEGEVAF